MKDSVIGLIVYKRIQVHSFTQVRVLPITSHTAISPWIGDGLTGGLSVDASFDRYTHNYQKYCKQKAAFIKNSFVI